MVRVSILHPWLALTRFTKPFCTLVSSGENGHKMVPTFQGFVKWLIPIWPRASHVSTPYKLIAIVIPLCSVVSDYLRPPWTVACQAPLVHGIFQARTLEWVAIFLLQGIFLTQGLKLRLLHQQVDSLSRAPLGEPRSRGAGSENQVLLVGGVPSGDTFSPSSFPVIRELN